MRILGQDRLQRLLSGREGNERMPTLLADSTLIAYNERQAYADACWATGPSGNSYEAVIARQSRILIWAKMRLSI
jgi:hypothetical protein